MASSGTLTATCCPMNTSKLLCYFSFNLSILISLLYVLQAKDAKTSLMWFLCTPTLPLALHRNSVSTGLHAEWEHKKSWLGLQLWRLTSRCWNYRFVRSEWKNWLGLLTHTQINYSSNYMESQTCFCLVSFSFIPTSFFPFFPFTTGRPLES